MDLGYLDDTYVYDTFVYGICSNDCGFFWVGMFKNVDLGLKILAYGTTGWFGVFIVLFLVQGCLLLPAWKL